MKIDLNQDTWKSLKEEGSTHYQKSPGEVEPIDLYRSLGTFWDWALTEIAQHALRNRSGCKVRIEDLDKIIHYTRLLRVMAREIQEA